MIPVWPTIERFLAEHGAAVLVTLAESAGSSPREAGARMVVRPDGRFSGTIGGGALEWLALAEAQQMMAGGGGSAAFRRLNKALGPELGQCCGGAVVLADQRPETIESLLRSIRGRLLAELHIDEQHGRRLLNGCPVIQAP